MTYHGVGDIGGMPTAKDNEPIKSYRVWSSMLDRCYSPNAKIRFPSYAGCSVCKEWLYYPNFLLWFDENYKNGFHLDKDLKNRGAKIYSHINCSFVPAEINSLTINKKSSRGLLPVGVVLHKSTGLFMSRMRKDGERILIGYFKDPVDAFDAYKEKKQMYIIKKANENFANGNICEQVFNTLIKWEVKIDD